MEKNNKAIIIGLITLIIGLGIGYGVGANKSNEKYEGEKSAMQTGQHVMNGQMMNNEEGMNMQDTMTSMNAALQGKTGDAFDQAFLSEMTVHHQGAVAMAQLALTNAKHQEIKDLAAGIIAAQNKEIGEMKAWQKSWYNQ